MRLVTFLLVSMFEWASLFILTFSIFMFKIKDNRVNILFSAAMLSMFSYIMRDVANMTAITPFLQLIFVFLIFWKLLRIPAIYAGVMSSFGYICYVFIQTLLMVALDLTGVLTFEALLNDHNLNYFAGSTTSIFSLIISYFLVRYRIGFSFIPDHSIKISLSGNINFLILTFLVALTLAIYLFSSQHGFFQWVFWGMTIIIGILLYLLIRREAGK